MSDEWIQRRLESYETNLADVHQRKNWQHKAKASYQAKFDALTERLRLDIEAYNKIFSAHPQCAATINPFRGGVGIACASKGTSVSVTPTNSGVIQIGWGGDSTTPPEKSDTLEVTTDDKGEVCYKHGNKLLADVAEASQIILSPILC